MLGAYPQYGRTLVPADEAKGAPPVVVLTNAYWQRIFGGDPNVIGQTLDLTVKKAQIVGVLAPGAHYATAAQAGFLRQLRSQRSLHERVDAGRSANIA